MRIILINILLISLFLFILSDEIPASFDCRVKWPKCVPKIYNQGSCGSCYAFSVATAFSMRYCIRNNLPEIIYFSAQNLVNCLSGCIGEFPTDSWIYLHTHGITTEECLSYKGAKRNCDSKCDSNNVKFNKYYAGKTKFFEDETEIKKEILKNGPVTSMMELFEDYYNYKSGIYIHNKEYNKTLGYHSIAILGWGVTDNIKYWLIQDSYGKSKGENGFIKIKIGDDSGAGATAYCDQIEGKYNDYNEEISTTHITVENTNKISKDTTVEITNKISEVIENTNKMSEIIEESTNKMNGDTSVENTDDNDEPIKINFNRGNYINILVEIKYFMIFIFISFIIF